MPNSKALCRVFILPELVFSGLAPPLSASHLLSDDVPYDVVERVSLRHEVGHVHGVPLADAVGPVLGLQQHSGGPVQLTEHHLGAEKRGRRGRGEV